MNKGWIKLKRSFIDWEWYSDHNATRLLIHLLCTVNYEEKKWRAITIEPGSIVISWETLSKSIGLTPRQCRTAMQKLETSGEVTRKTTNKYQVVTLVKWDKIQINGSKVDSQQVRQKSDKSQTDDRQVTTTKEDKEDKENKEIKNIPTYSEFFDYAISKYKNVNEEALKLKYDAWVENGWKTGGKTPRKIKNWKTTLLNTLPWLKEKSSGKKEKRSAAEIIRERHGIQ